MRSSYKKTILTFMAVLLCFTSSVQAQEVVKLPNYSLKYSVEVKASKETIWDIWIDVKNWKDFDERLEYSYLVDDAAFKEGTIGYLKAKNAPKTKFEIIEFDDKNSFIQSLKTPFYQTIELQRYFEKNKDGELLLVHEVNFKGRLRATMYALLYRPFKKDLKLVVNRIKELAEEKQSNLKR